MRRVGRRGSVVSDRPALGLRLELLGWLLRLRAFLPGATATLLLSRAAIKREPSGPLESRVAGVLRAWDIQDAGDRRRSGA